MICANYQFIVSWLKTLLCFLLCNNNRNNDVNLVNSFPYPVGTTLSLLVQSVDPAGGRVFSSWFQGALLSKRLQCVAASSTSPWIASPRRQLPRSSPLQENRQWIPPYRTSANISTILWANTTPSLIKSESQPWEGYSLVFVPSLGVLSQPKR